jgi:hypothetical protein
VGTGTSRPISGITERPFGLRSQGALDVAGAIAETGGDHLIRLEKVEHAG